MSEKVQYKVTYIYERRTSPKAQEQLTPSILLIRTKRFYERRSSVQSYLYGILRQRIRKPSWFE